MTVGVVAGGRTGEGGGVAGGRCGEGGTGAARMVCAGFGGMAAGGGGGVAGRENDIYPGMLLWDTASVAG